MLAKINRLPRYVIRSLLQSGKRYHSQNFTYIVSRSDAQINRSACVVSLKIAKTVVVRNRTKRLIHEALSHIFHNSNILLDILVIVKKDISGLKENSIEKELQEVIQQLAS